MRIHHESAGGEVVVSENHGGRFPGHICAADSLRDGGALISLLVLIAAVTLLFTGRYPRGLFDLVVGLDRWVVRVIAYVSLLTDLYPPFRLDLGGCSDGPLPPQTSPGEVRATA